MKTRLDMEKIAKGLGAVRRGKVSPSAGYFGALQLLADVEARFRTPAGGGRPTDPMNFVPFAASNKRPVHSAWLIARSSMSITVRPL
jgi:hypothetical protein